MLFYTNENSRLAYVSSMDGNTWGYGIIGPTGPFVSRDGGISGISSDPLNLRVFYVSPGTGIYVATFDGNKWRYDEA